MRKIPRGFQGDAVYYCTVHAVWQGTSRAVGVKRTRRAICDLIRFRTAVRVDLLRRRQLYRHHCRRVPYTEFAPTVMTQVRRFNLWIVSGAGIHSSVFPSAHVSAAFSAAFALLLCLPRKKWAGWSMFAYACSVAVATVYGRYHYAVDAGAGIAVASLAAVVIHVATGCHPPRQS